MVVAQKNFLFGHNNDNLFAITSFDLGIVAVLRELLAGCWPRIRYQTAVTHNIDIDGGWAQAAWACHVFWGKMEAF